MEIIVGRGRSKATQRIEINDPNVSREHCRLRDNGDGTYTLENVSSLGTMVDGRKVVKATVKPNTLIQLSPNTTVRVSDLLPLQGASASPAGQAQGAAQQAAPKPAAAAPGAAPVETVSILPLQAIWNEYHNTQMEIKQRQRLVGQLRGASPIFTMGSGSIAALAKSMEWGSGILGLTTTLTVIGLILMIYSFVKGYKDDSIEATERATDLFQHKYVCPKCGHFMGNQPYHLIRQNKACPWCKCKFVEK